MTAANRKTFFDIIFPSLIAGGISGILGPLVDPNHPFMEMAVASSIMGFVGISLILCFEKLVKRSYLIKLNFIWVWLISALGDSLIFFLVMVATITTMGLENEETSVFLMIQRPDFLMGLGIFGVMALIVQFILQINTLIGQGVLLKIFLGQYHKPRETERFFLFLDLKSSTSIAEKIGHLKFLSLLNDFFYDLSEAVVLSRGEIYKYVGDEAIVVWDRKKGIQNSNPLFCFFSLEEQVRKRKDYYLKTYSLVPQFKARLHFGKVVVGELGNHRKEIAFLGDAVNTTARIEGECNRLKADLLVSGQALEQFDLPSVLTSQNLGKVSLRGRVEEIELFSLGRKG